MNLNDLRMMLAPLANRVANMVGRGIVKVVDDAKKIQELQVVMLNGETRSDVERLQNYGFTSNPKPDAEAVVAFVGGRRDHGYVLGVDDRRYRICNLESGEVCVYNNTGAKIVIKTNGDIEVTPKTGQKLALVGDMTISGKLDVTGKGTFSGAVDVGTTLTASTDVVGGGKHLKTHVHAGGSLGGTSTTSGSPFTVSTGDSAAPS